MKKIRIFTYTKVNLGDDLFIRILCERYKNTEFIIYAPKIYKKIFKNTKSLKVISSDKPFNKIFGFLYRKINYLDMRLSSKADAIVQIGGSLFIENNNWKDKFNY